MRGSPNIQERFRAAVSADRSIAERSSTSAGRITATGAWPAIRRSVYWKSGRRDGGTSRVGCGSGKS